MVVGPHATLVFEPLRMHSKGFNHELGSKAWGPLRKEEFSDSSAWASSYSMKPSYDLRKTVFGIFPFFELSFMAKNSSGGSTGNEMWGSHHTNYYACVSQITSWGSDHSSWILFLKYIRANIYKGDQLLPSYFNKTNFQMMPRTGSIMLSQLLNGIELWGSMSPNDLPTRQLIHPLDPTPAAWGPTINTKGPSELELASDSGEGKPRRWLMSSQNSDLSKSIPKENHGRTLSYSRKQPFLESPKYSCGREVRGLHNEASGSGRRLPFSTAVDWKRPTEFIQPEKGVEIIDRAPDGMGKMRFVPTFGFFGHTVTKESSIFPFAKEKMFGWTPYAAGVGGPRRVWKGTFAFPILSGDLSKIPTAF